MNREKALFAVSAGIALLAACYFTLTRPRELSAGKPMAYGQTLPLPLKSKRLALEPHPSNRDRENPFVPYREPVISVPVKVERVVAGPGGVKVPPNGGTVTDKSDTKTFNAELLESAVHFVGVATIETGARFGLLKYNDGSATVRVQEGSTVDAGGQKYTVISIGRQSIQLIDSKQRPYELRDSDDVRETALTKRAINPRLSGAR